MFLTFIICLSLFIPDKPPIEDLQYFLDFQIAQVWAPEQNSLQRKEPVCSSLQFSLMGPKLYISPDQVLLLVLISSLIAIIIKLLCGKRNDSFISLYL